MKNYNVPFIPSIVSNISKRERNMGYYATEFSIPNPKIGVNYYGNLDDSPYNVFRVDAVAVVGTGADMLSIMLIHTPDGVQHTLFNDSTGAETRLNYFETKEDFMAYSLKGIHKINRMPYITLKEFLGDALSTYDTYFYGYQGNKFDISGFAWRNRRVEREKAYFDIAWRDENDLHIIFDDDLYTTREECFEDNFKINDGAFTEDAPQIKSYTISVQIEVQAKSETEAKRIVKEKIADITE